MWKNINLEKVRSYLDAAPPAKTRLDGKNESKSFASGSGASEARIHAEATPSVTISRMCGAGGRTVASLLADFLQAHTLADRQWTVFDKNLIEKVLEDHHLSKRLAEYLPEGHKSFFAETIEKMRGLHPSTATMVKHISETIWNLAANGYVILVGRAANAITEKLDNVCHVRLVGSLENRIARVEKVYDLGRTEAREFIKSQDEGKRQYMKDYFNRDIEDPLLYHLTINTDDVSYESAARLIGEAVIAASNRPPPQKATAG